MTQVFLSYSRKDLDFVERLASDLKATGLDVWYDLSGLEGGARWRIEIEKAIKESQYVLIVLSPDSVVSEWVEEEILFSKYQKLKIIPLLYRQCDLPLGYQTRHYIDVQGINYKRNFDEILRALGVKPGMQVQPPLPEQEEPVSVTPEKKEATSKRKKGNIQPTWNSKNTIILVALIGLVLVAVFSLSPLLTQPGNTTLPTQTFTPEVFKEPTSTASITECDKAEFIADLTVPDGTQFSQGEQFVKSWKIRNAGTCTWTPDYALVFDSGESMVSSTSPVSLKSEVLPNETINIEIPMQAPGSPGVYRGNWLFRNASGVLFGWGENADTPIWVEIKVVGTSTATSLPTEFTDEFGVEMVLVSQGEFVMGSSIETALENCPSCDPEELADVTPPHTVSLKAFYIDKYEVTNFLYAACVRDRVCVLPRETSRYTNSDYDNHPVVYVDWGMAKNFCEWRGTRLPTEAEWEKAARGADRRIFPWGNAYNGTFLNFCDVGCPYDWRDANYKDGFSDTSPVDFYPDGVSPYGLYNMSGNVLEWVADWYQPKYYSTLGESITDPPGPLDGDERVARGGSWWEEFVDARTFVRDHYPPTDAPSDIGFRCARDAVLPLTSKETPNSTALPTAEMISNQDWVIYTQGNQGSTIEVGPEDGTSNSIRINFNLLQEDWAAVFKKLPPKLLAGTQGLVISYKGLGAPNTVDVKLIHTDEAICHYVLYNKTNTNNTSDSLEIPYSEFDCGATVLNLDNIDRIDFSFSNWPTFGDEPGEGEMIVEMIQPVP